MSPFPRCDNQVVSDNAGSKVSAATPLASMVNKAKRVFLEHRERLRFRQEGIGGQNVNVLALDKC